MAKTSTEFYENWILKPIIAERQKELHRLNTARWQFFQFKMLDNRKRKDTIPTMEDYRTRVREMYKIKKKETKRPTRRMIAEDRRVNV